MIKRYEGTGRMSRVVEHNNTLYLCGQTHNDPESGIKLQTIEVLEKIERLLDEYGSDKNHILEGHIHV